MYAIIGLVLLCIGWFFEAIEVIRKKKSKLDLKFALLYTIGSFLLVVYAIQIGDVIFIILNSVVVLFSLISLIYSIRK